jgi:hypothetical protein
VSPAGQAPSVDDDLLAASAADEEAHAREILEAFARDSGELVFDGDATAASLTGPA